MIKAATDQETVLQVVRGERPWTDLRTLGIEIRLEGDRCHFHNPRDIQATVHARDLARATATRMRHSVVVKAASMRDPLIAEADIVVNATPVGMSSDEHPVELDRVAPNAIIVDLVYAPKETSWVRESRARGHRSIDGLSMLLHQGVAAYECWFGEEPDQSAMKKALLEAAGRT